MTVRAIKDLTGAVRGRRVDLGISQGELAERAGVSRKWVYEFEAGKPTAELALVLRVLDALGLVFELGQAPESAAPPAGGGRKRIDLDAILEEHRGS